MRFKRLDKWIDESPETRSCGLKVSDEQDGTWTLRLMERIGSVGVHKDIKVGISDLLSLSQDDELSRAMSEIGPEVRVS